jgi:protein TonB
MVVLAHVAVFVGLQSLGMVPLPTPPRPMVVDLLQAPASETQAPVSTPSKPALDERNPSAVALQTVPRPLIPLLASESARLEPTSESPKPDGAPASLVPVAAVPSTAPAAPAAPAPLTAPRFDAAYLDNPTPNYPPLSRRGREEGRVVLRVLVEASGLAATLQVQSSSGFERLDRAASAAVSHWKFVPARQGSEAVAAWVLVPIVFSLKE